MLIELPRVILIDDHNLIRAGLRKLLEDGLATVVAEAVSAAEGLERCLEMEHDIVILDLHLPGHDGLWLLEELHQRGWNKKVLVVSVQSHEQQVLGAFRAGAHGYLTKAAEPAEFRAAIHEILQGGSYIEARLAGRLLRKVELAKSTDRKNPKAVTARERGILALVAQGRSNQEISSFLHLSEATVKTHLNNLFRKLSVGTRTEAVMAGMRLGLISNDSPEA